MSDKIVVPQYVWYLIGTLQLFMYRKSSKSLINIVLKIFTIAQTPSLIKNGISCTYLQC